MMEWVRDDDCDTKITALVCPVSTMFWKEIDGNWMIAIEGRRWTLSGTRTEEQVKNVVLWHLGERLVGLATEVKSEWQRMLTHELVDKGQEL